MFFLHPAKRVFRQLGILLLGQAYVGCISSHKADRRKVSNKQSRQQKEHESKEHLPQEERGRRRLLCMIETTFPAWLRPQLVSACA